MFRSVSLSRRNQQPVLESHRFSKEKCQFSLDVKPKHTFSQTKINEKNSLRSGPSNNNYSFRIINHSTTTNDEQQANNKQPTSNQQATNEQPTSNQRATNEQPTNKQRTNNEQTTNKQRTNNEQTTNEQQTNNKRTTNEQQANNKQTTNKQQTNNKRATSNEQRATSNEQRTRQQTNKHLEHYVHKPIVIGSSFFASQVLLEELGRFFWEPSMTHNCESSRARARLQGSCQFISLRGHFGSRLPTHKSRSVVTF